MADTALVRDEDKTEKNIVARNVSMYADQWATVEEINERYDFRNVSNALRFLINDYRRLRNLESAIRQADPKSY